MEPLAWVHAVERLVEDEDRRIVDERGRDLDALLHPLRVAADRAPGCVVQVHQADGSLRRAARVVELLELGGGGHELEPGQEAVHGLALRHETHAPVELGVPPGGRLIELDGAGARAEEARHHMQQGRLARAVRPQQPGDAGADVERDVVDRHDVAVPARGRLQAQDAHTVMRRYRTNSTSHDPSMRSAAARPKKGSGTSLAPTGDSATTPPKSHCLAPSMMLSGLRNGA